jgi:tetratricopeptide (TPR) repeat protein
VDLRLTWKQRILGLGILAEGRLARLLILHRQAFDAELQGHHNRADFFWREFHTYLKKHWPDQTTWAVLFKIAKLPAGTACDNPEQFRERLLEEVFIDTHCAFYNGRIRDVEEVEPNDRAFVHADYITMLTDLAGYSDSLAIPLLGPPFRLRIQAYRAAKQWKNAIRICNQILARFPNSKEFQDALAGLYVESTFSGMKNGKSEKESLADAKRLEIAIKRIELARRTYPFNVEFYRALGQCHYVRGIKLANGGRLSEALAAVRWAQKYDPYLNEAYKTEEQLVTMMNDLRAQVEQLQAELARRRGGQLTEQGQRMVREAKRGFTPINEVEASAKATQMQVDFRRAQAREVWGDIGLAEPGDNWDEQASALLGALSGVVANSPKEPTEVTQAWAEAVGGNAQLAALDHPAIESFLRRRLFGESEPAIQQPAESIEDAPILICQPTRARDIEPLGYWLFSRQGLGVKLQALAATALLIFAGFSYFDDAHNRLTREQAYKDLHDAVTTSADERVLQAAETFLAAKVRGSDGREADVRRRYDQSFTRWFVSRGSETDEDTRAHVERYRALAAR